MKPAALKKLIHLAEGHLDSARASYVAAETSVKESLRALDQVKVDRARVLVSVQPPVATAVTAALDTCEESILRPRLAAGQAAADAARARLKAALRDRHALERLAALRRAASDARLRALEAREADDVASPLEAADPLCAEATAEAR